MLAKFGENLRMIWTIILLLQDQKKQMVKGKSVFSCTVWAPGSRKIFASFTFAEDNDKKDYNKVTKKFAEYFEPKKLT